MKPAITVLAFSVLFFSSLVLGGQRIVVPDMARTIQKGIDMAREGDTVFVRVGTYNEHVTLHEGIALVGADWQNSIISGNGRDPVVRGADNALIKNLTIKNGGRGILCENTNPTIDHCIITNNKKSGIHCLMNLPMVHNSIISDNQWTGIFCESCRGLRGTTINHNVIARNRYCGVMLAGTSEVLIHSTIFFENREYAVFFSDASQRSRIDHNDFYFNRKVSNLQRAVQTNNIAVDPQFFPLEGDNFNFTRAQAVALQTTGKDSTAIGIMTDPIAPPATTIADTVSAPAPAKPAADSAKK
ncbi:MAG: right-handed parallel beta-helix repeat-containing protein [Chitinivibrionales bacterium]|nr:right-handed parallel beta-helix repeat-containing protein [Chitinivibrionales bacterium]